MMLTLRQSESIVNESITLILNNKIGVIINLAPKNWDFHSDPLSIIQTAPISVRGISPVSLTIDSGNASTTRVPSSHPIVIPSVLLIFVPVALTSRAHANGVQRARGAEQSRVGLIPTSKDQKGGAISKSYLLRTTTKWIDEERGELMLIMIMMRGGQAGVLRLCLFLSGKDYIMGCVVWAWWGRSVDGKFF